MKTLCLALVSLVSAALFVQALPTPQGTVTHLYGKRIADSDVLIFKFADLLEQLEGTYYKQVLSRYKASDFRAAGFQGNVSQIMALIQRQEETHSAFLQTELKSVGQSPLSCKFDFTSVLTNVASAVALARTAEQIGTSAYAGAAHLLADPSYLTKAATIMSDEARHSSTLNTISGTGSPFPSPFDIALNGNEVLALVGPLISGPCNTSIPANPVLTITNKWAIKAGTLVNFTSTAFNSKTENLFCQIISGNTTQAVSMPLRHCIVPKEDIAGPAYIWVTSDDKPLPNDVVARADSKVVAGPALTFIDS